MTEAIVAGSGPNGFAAAIELARAGLRVTLVEEGTLGGGMRTEELTLPGFRHDVCSAVHPLAVASPFFRSVPLEEHGLRWIHPSACLAHPLDSGEVALLETSVDRTAARFGSDGSRYRALFAPVAARWPHLAGDLLAPFHFPRHPVPFVLFGLRALWPATWLARICFRSPSARAVFAGMAAHSFLPLNRMLSGAFGLMLGSLAHVGGWPVAEGGSASIAQAMRSYFESLGGTVATGTRLSSLGEASRADIVVLDMTPRQLLRLAGDELPQRYARRLENYRYGPGVFKVDWALSGAIPWRSAECRKAATVHVGGTMEEIAQGEAQVWRGGHPERPFVLLVQPTLFDPTRAPAGCHTGWAYCHVPNGSTVDMTDIIEKQIERFAPGFRQLILARHTRNCREYEAHNPNYIGGDINGGVQDFAQFLRRPTLLSPYRTPLPGVYLASSATPPGGGVHGMAGYHAARTALRDLREGRVRRVT